MEAFETSAYLEMIRMEQNLEFQMDTPPVSLAEEERARSLEWTVGKEWWNWEEDWFLGDNHIGELRV